MFLMSLGRLLKTLAKICLLELSMVIIMIIITLIIIIMIIITLIIVIIMTIMIIIIKMSNSETKIYLKGKNQTFSTANSS